MGTLTSAGGTTLTGPFVVTSAGPAANATSAKAVSANALFFIGPNRLDIKAVTTAAQSAPAFAEASGFAAFARVNVGGTLFGIPLVSASF